MAIYCQAGDIARVTFPDGSIQSFADTPINILVSEEFGNSCQQVFLRFYSSKPNINPANSGYVFAPVVGTKIISTYFFYAICRGGRNSGHTCQANFLDHYLSIADYSFNYSITNYTVHRLADGVQIPPKYRIKITNISGTEIFNQLFDTDNYSVDCLQFCPPNHLDCGDCCLDCNNIFNQISGIRALLARIK